MSHRSGTRGSGPRSLSATWAASWRHRAPPWWLWPARRCTWPAPASPCLAGACLLIPGEYKDSVIPGEYYPQVHVSRGHLPPGVLQASHHDCVRSVVCCWRLVESDFNAHQFPAPAPSWATSRSTSRWPSRAGWTASSPSPRWTSCGRRGWTPTRRTTSGLERHLIFLHPSFKLLAGWTNQIFTSNQIAKWYYSSEVTTTTIRRGSLYTVRVTTTLDISSTSDTETSQYFICQLSIPNTDVARTEQTVFFPGTITKSF